MDTNFENSKEKILKAINSKNPNIRCPFCGHGALKLVGGYFAHDIQQDLVSRQMGGQNIPTVPIVCQNCGFIMEFAAGALGLLPNNDDQKNA